METMIERGVQALYGALEEHLVEADGLALQSGRIFIGGADAHFDPKPVVMAVLAVMREPTVPMLVAADAAYFAAGPSVADCERSLAEYRAMIDAAVTPDAAEALPPVQQEAQTEAPQAPEAR